MLKSNTTYYKPISETCRRPNTQLILTRSRVELLSAETISAADVSFHNQSEKKRNLSDFL